MNGNRTVTATFTQDEYTLTLTTVGNGTVGLTPDQATYHYGETVELSATADPGWDIRRLYRRRHWYDRYDEWQPDGDGDIHTG